MPRDELVDLNAFLAVAQERSFTRAAARLGTSQSALSYTVRRLENHMGVRLLTRTTRSVSPTQAGEQLLRTLEPALRDIAAEIAAIRDLREKPSGTIRLTLSKHAAETIVWPCLEKLLPGYPELNVELSIDSGLTDIAANRFDAGVRLGEAVAKDMIATRIGPDLRLVVVGSPDYLRGRPIPQEPQDLSAHKCINMRMISAGSLYAWELEMGAEEVRVRVEGQLAFNDSEMILNAAIAGFGLAFVMEDRAAAHLAAGRLVCVMEDWCPPFSGYHLYYPSRRQHSAAFSLLLEALRYRGPLWPAA